MSTNLKFATIYSKKDCEWCVKAYDLIYSRGYILYEKKIDTNLFYKQQMLNTFPDAKTVPQCILDDQPIGGYEAVKEYLG
jgi:glutaredoxin